MQVTIPSREARDAVKILIKTLGQSSGVDPLTTAGSKAVLPLVNKIVFETTPVTYWQSSLRSVLRSAYNNSPASAICDLVENDPDFYRVRRVGLSTYDFNPAPNNTWTDREGYPTDSARKVGRLALEKVARKLGVDLYDLSGLLAVREELNVRNFREIKVDSWGTRPGSMLKSAHGDDLSMMIADLIVNEDRFEKIRRALSS